jgi:regulator of protease activity HflC (stomatin/prohibitin superfamily)
MGKHEVFTGAQRVAKRRAALRAQGLRPRQFWLPDLRNPVVRAEIAADAAILAAQAHRWQDIMDDAEAMVGEVLAEMPSYDWGDDPRGNSEMYRQ